MINKVQRFNMIIEIFATLHTDSADTLFLLSLKCFSFSNSRLLIVTLSSFPDVCL